MPRLFYFAIFIFAVFAAAIDAFAHFSASPDADAFAFSLMPMLPCHDFLLYGYALMLYFSLPHAAFAISDFQMLLISPRHAAPCHAFFVVDASPLYFRHFASFMPPIRVMR